LFLPAVLARDFSEGWLSRLRGVTGRRCGFLRVERVGRIAPRLNPCSIFRRQDSATLQVLLGVHVFGALAMVFLARMLLTGSFAQILRVARRRRDEVTTQEKTTGETDSVARRQPPRNRGRLA